MPKLRGHNFAISVDGYGAGPSQSLDNPLGVGGERLHEWGFATRYGRRMIGEEGGAEGIDERFLVAGGTGRGGRGRGGGGAAPPYHHPVFALTRHSRPSVVMKGGTTFNFVTDGIEAALSRAFEAAGGADVRLGGGVATIQQYLRARLIDELHVAIVPIFLGGGERLFDGLDGGPVGYGNVEMVGSASVTHVRFVRQ